MIIKEYSDLKKVKNNTIVDLNYLNPKMVIRAIDFLAGLTCKKGSLKKLESNKFLVIIGD